MEIKSFNEVKRILKKFPEASGVGYVLTGQVLKIAKQLGMIGYAEALMAWHESKVFSEKVFDNDADALRADVRLIINWKGLGLRLIENTYIVGLYRTIEDIEEALK